MLLAASALAFALLGQEKGGPAATEKPAAPAVDRSAEPALKSLFAASGALRGVQISIEIYPYEQDAQRYNDDSSLQLWMGDGGRFRIESSSNYWGGGSIWVSDGESLLTDDMSDDGSIRLTKLKKSLHEVNDQEPIMFLLEGQTGFDALVDKDKPVKFASGAGTSDQSIELHSKKLGKIVLYYKNGSPIPTAIETYQVPWWLGPDAAAPDHASSREEIRVVSHGPFASHIFSVAAPKGKNIIDERTKP